MSLKRPAASMATVSTSRLKKLKITKRQQRSLQLMADIIDLVGSQSSQSVEETEDTVDTSSEDTLNALSTCNTVSACGTLHSEIKKLADIIAKQQDRIRNIELQMSKILSLLQNVSDVQQTQLKSINTFADLEVKVAHHSSASIKNQSSPIHGIGKHAVRENMVVDLVVQDKLIDKRVNRYNTNDANAVMTTRRHTRQPTHTSR